LQKYHQWWYSYRDSDKNGLCEYGSSNGSLEAAKWESGMDNAIRFDNSKMVKINNSNWAFNQESVDLNSFLFAEKQYLAKMAVVLKNTTFYEKITSEAEILAQQIREKMFDSETGYFYDIDLITKKIIPIQGPEGWIPLWAGIATAEEADKVVSVMLDTTKFATYIPFPTAPKDNPEFGDGYWRGPIWLDQVYFAVTALKNYGYETQADSCVKVVFDKLEGLKNSDLPIRENYRPLTGEGIRVNHFSWSAAHLLLLYQNK
jgi:putative isomerase